MEFVSRNPADGAVVGRYEGPSAAESREWLSRMGARQTDWDQAGFGVRAAAMRAAAAGLRADPGGLAELMAREMGKPVRDGVAEVEKCAWVLDYYAENAEGFLAPEAVASDATSSRVICRPLGVILGVMPWNFPLWQVFRFAAPTLMAGNGVALKHASSVPGCALAIERIFRDAGVPENVFRTFLVPGAAVSDLIGHPAVAGVSLTGSVAAGRAVAASAGRALKPCVLELGGSDPYLVLEDADLELAAESCVTSRMINSGQSCIAAKRFIVVDAVRDTFEGMVIERMADFVPGDPFDPGTTLGPLARVDLRDELHDQVTRAVDAGAELRLGGSVPARPGAWYPATVLTGVEPGTPAFEEETFGPVAAIVASRDEAHAIELANATAFGLGAAVFTRDPERGRRIAEEGLHAGAAFVNSHVRSDPRLPFGGIGDSGFGRELGAFGIREFVNVKTIWER